MKTTPATLRRWVQKGEIPDARAALVESVIEQRFDSMELRRAQRQKDQDIQLRRFKGIPLSVQRYAKRKVKDADSGVIEVDTRGLSYPVIGDILRGLWGQLKETGLRWDVRFTAMVDVSNYFKGGVEDMNVYKSIRDRSVMPMVIPFTRPRFVPDKKNKDIKNADDALRWVNSELHGYRSRIRDQDGFLKVSLIPYAARKAVSPEQRHARSRRGKPK
jgi:hypothetical protein